MRLEYSCINIFNRSININKSFIIIITSFIFLTTNLSSQSFDFVSIPASGTQNVASSIATSIFNEAGYELNITPLPGKRAQDYSTSGEKDGELIRIYKFGEINKTLVRVPTPISSISTRAWTRKDNPIKIESLEDIRNYKVAIIRGIQLTTDMVKDFPNVEEVKDIESLMKMLDFGRVDIVITSYIGALS